MAQKQSEVILGALRILIVDDSAIVRGAIRDLLRSSEEEFAIYELEDAQSAIRQAREVRPHVVLLDLGVPAASGFAVAEQLREEHPSLAVIVMSQQDPSVLQKLAEHYGSRLFLPKSALASELVPMLRGITASKSAHPVL